jgi:hypothetical protein
MIIFNPGVLIAMIFALFSWVISRKTKSIRLGLIALYTCLLTGFALFTAVGIWLRGPDWEFSLGPFF